MKAKRVKHEPVPPPPDTIEMSVSIDEARFIRDFLGRLTTGKDCSVDHYAMYLTLDNLLPRTPGEKFRFIPQSYGKDCVAFDVTDK